MRKTWMACVHTHLHVGVRVDAARDDELAGGIDDARSLWHLEVRAHSPGERETGKGERFGW